MYVSSLAQLNSLNQVISNPDEVKKLVLNIDEKSELGNLLELKNLEHLEIHVKDEIQIELPEELYQLVNLKLISITGKNISKGIRDNLDLFKNLNTLYINDNCQNIDFPKLSTSLRNLNLVVNNVRNLNSSIKNLRFLRQLAVNSSSLKTISSELKELKDLESLTVRCRNLSEFPEGITELSELRDLDLYIETNMEIPAKLNRLQKLERFRWGKCKQFPEYIYECENLKELTFDNSFFDTIPSGISSLQELRELDLSFGRFRLLPKDFDQVETLEELELTGSKIEKLPRDLSRLVKLKWINFQYCEDLIYDVDLLESLKSIRNLENLDLRYSGLSKEYQVKILSELTLRN